MASFKFVALVLMMVVAVTVACEGHEDDDVCANFECPDVQICFPKVVYCFAAPCPPIPTCIDDPCATVRCKEGYKCEAISETSANCTLVVPEPAEDEDVCAGFECPDVQICFPQIVNCLVAPCPPIPICINDPCATVRCRDGYKCEAISETRANCTLVVPEPEDEDVCAGFECPDVQICFPEIVNCFVAPCPPLPNCVDDPCATVRCIDGYKCEAISEKKAKCTQVIPEPDEETCFCPLIYTPLCGADGTTYGNDCFLACANVELDHEGVCEDCVCPLLYAPVCGEDGATYSNDCFLACAGVNASHAGECGCVCPENFDPVCGSDGETYPNGCFLACAGVAAADDAAVCECVCTEEYAPVCGADGVTYANPCFQACAGAKPDYEGECAV